VEVTPRGRGQACKKTSTPFAREQRFFNVVSCFPSVLRGRIQVHGRRRRHPQWPEASQGSFQHIPGTRTPAALAVGDASSRWTLQGLRGSTIETGTITRIVAGIGTAMEDVGLRTMQSTFRTRQSPSTGPPDTYWLPSVATIEVETRHQHWRNTHRFSDYKRFSVNTKETQSPQMSTNISVSRAMTVQVDPRKRTAPSGYRLCDCGSADPNSNRLWIQLLHSFPGKPRALSEARMA